MKKVLNQIKWVINNYLKYCVVITWLFWTAGNSSRGKWCRSYWHSYAGYLCSTTCGPNWAATKFSPCATPATVCALYRPCLTDIWLTFFIWKSIFPSFRSCVSIHHVNFSFTVRCLLWWVSSVCNSTIHKLPISVGCVNGLTLTPRVMWSFTYCVNLSHFPFCEGFISCSFPLHSG